MTRTRLADSEGAGNLFARIRSDDLLVHLPYESFVTSVEAFVRAAAKDPGVVGIKTTVYRTSDDTALLPALIEAVERGKQAVCLVELKARFDERRNIEWSQAMEQAGVHVVHGFRDLKIHAKTTLVDPARGRRAASVRAHRHRQLQRRHRPPLRGPWPLHRRRGDHRRRRRSLQPHDGVRTAAAVPEAARRHRSTCARASSTTSARLPTRPPRARRRGSG